MAANDIAALLPLLSLITRVPPESEITRLPIIMELPLKYKSLNLWVLVPRSTASVVRGIILVVISCIAESKLNTGG